MKINKALHKTQKLKDKIPGNEYRQIQEIVLKGKRNTGNNDKYPNSLYIIKCH